jgi:nucleotide-binding universal stress UspA family protein
MFPIRRILCPTDFSEGASEAISQASEFALQAGAAIYLVNVIPVLPALPTDPNFVFKVPEYERALHADAHRHLEQLAQGLRAKRLETQTFVGHGDAAAEIVRIAKQEQVDLIVIATYGKTGWRRFAFGSVTEKVVRLATCPVLTLRGGVETSVEHAA